MSDDQNIRYIFNNLGDSLIQWIIELEDSLHLLSKRSTGSDRFVERQIKRKIDEFYEFVQKALDDVYDLLDENGLNELTPAWEAEILKTLRPTLKELQGRGDKILRSYSAVLDQLPKEMIEELKGICFDMSAEDVLKIVKDYLREQK